MPRPGKRQRVTQTMVSRPQVASDVLTHAEAEARAARVSYVDYELAFTLLAEALDYSGETSISFSVSSLDDPLFIDYKGERITRLVVNGRDADIDLRDNRLW